MAEVLEMVDNRTLPVIVTDGKSLCLKIRENMLRLTLAQRGWSQIPDVNGYEAWKCASPYNGMDDESLAAFRKISEGEAKAEDCAGGVFWFLGPVDAWVFV
jgi:hypothetical protein